MSLINTVINLLKQPLFTTANLSKSATKPLPVSGLFLFSTQPTLPLFAQPNWKIWPIITPNSKKWA